MPQPDPASIRRVARRLWNAIEPIASSVYFVAEVQEAYGRIGFPNYWTSYFCSRSACLGQQPPLVVAATFGVFDPAIVTRAIEGGWAVTTPEAALAARLEGATAGLRRMLDDVVDAGAVKRATEILARAGDAAASDPGGYPGRPLFAALHGLGLPGDGAYGDLWRAADVLREHRGDSHVVAWTAMGLSAVEIGLLTELWWGGEPRRYIRTRGWDDAALDAGTTSLQERGFLTHDDPAVFTSAGEEVRAVIEEMTDRGEAAIVDSIGADEDELFALIEPMAKAIVAAQGYPRDPSDLPHAR
jgi:hypothetical protein